jgi:hypothetical protein
VSKPKKYPDWSVDLTTGADNDIVNPDTNQKNVVEPPDAQKEIGWDYTQNPPPRQYFNWLARLVTQWIRWLDRDWYGETTLGNAGYDQMSLPTGYTKSNCTVLCSWVSNGGNYGHALPYVWTPDDYSRLFFRADEDAVVLETSGVIWEGWILKLWLRKTA